MALKPKNTNNFRAKSHVTSTIPWPNLPQQLTNIIAKKSSLMQNFSFGSDITWRSTPKKSHQTALISINLHNPIFIIINLNTKLSINFKSTMHTAASQLNDTCFFVTTKICKQTWRSHL